MKVICRISNQYPIQLTSIMQLLFCFKCRPRHCRHRNDCRQLCSADSLLLPTAVTCLDIFSVAFSIVFTDFAIAILKPDKTKWNAYIWLGKRCQSINKQTNKRLHLLIFAATAATVVVQRVNRNECASYPRQQKWGKICMPSWLCVNGMHLCWVESYRMQSIFRRRRLTQVHWIVVVDVTKVQYWIYTHLAYGFFFVWFAIVQPTNKQFIKFSCISRYEIQCSSMIQFTLKN